SGSGRLAQPTITTEAVAVVAAVVSIAGAAIAATAAAITEDGVAAIMAVAITHPDLTTGWRLSLTATMGRHRATGRTTTKTAVRRRPTASVSFLDFDSWTLSSVVS